MFKKISHTKWFRGALTAVGLLALVVMVALAAGGQTTLISSSDGSQMGDYDSLLSSISHNGNYITFMSEAQNLVAGQPESDLFVDIYLNNTTNGEVSRISNGANSSSTLPSISRVNGDVDNDGRFIAFQSYSSTFSKMAGGESDPGPNSDVFLYDHQADLIYAISKGYGGAETNGDSGAPGRISFGWPEGNGGVKSAIDNPVHPGSAVYVRDDPNDNPDGGMQPYVVFESLATNLVNPATNGKQHLFARDFSGGTTTLLTRTADGSAEANGDSTHPVVSTDGRFVVFVSNATNLVGGVTNGHYHIYLLDRDDDRNGTYDEYGGSGSVRYYLVSGYYNGGTDYAAVGNGSSWYPSITTVGDGISQVVYIVYQSAANNLLGDGADSNNATDIFLYSLPPNAVNKYQTTFLISRASGGSGAQGNFHSLTPNISGDGKFIAFTSYSTNLVLMDSNYNCLFDFNGLTYTNCPDIFVRYYDINYGVYQTWRVSLTSIGTQALYNSSLPSMNGDGSLAAFTSYSDLRENYVFDQLESMQIFMRNQGEGEDIGNPNIQPSTGDFYAPEGQPTWITFTLTFLGPLTIDHGGDGLIRVVGEDAANFVIPSESDTCSGGAFSAGDTCSFAVVFTPDGTDVRTAQVRIPVDDARGYLYVGLRGYTIVRYFPLLTMQ
jgi:Tol biopolymer transport system component